MPDRSIDYRAIERQLTEALGLQRRPVAVAFRSTPPAGIPKFTGTEPSGCSFWRLAAAERTFYTVAADHHNCPIGSYTHNMPLPPERSGELTQTLGLMTELGYLKMEEVPGIPRLAVPRCRDLLAAVRRSGRSRRRARRRPTRPRDVAPGSRGARRDRGSRSAPRSPHVHGASRVDRPGCDREHGLCR